MNLSLDEYRALVAKAFRGAGYTWGQTEDASWAAARLSTFDDSSPSRVLALLDHVDEVEGGSGGSLSSRMPSDDWMCDADALCPVSTGTTLLDLGFPNSQSPHAPTLVIGPTLAPELLAPFLQQMLEHTWGQTAPSGGQTPLLPVEAYEIGWHDGSCVVTATGMGFVGARVARTAEVAIRGVRPPELHKFGGVRPPEFTRVRLETAVLSGLERYAHRVYAPATAASRKAGAGAGETDND